MTGAYRPLFDEPRRLVIVDAHAHAHRAFHALDAMHAPDGFPTNALYGFMGLVRRIVMDDRPDYFVVVFDAPDDRRVTFRSALYPAYKAHRGPRAPDLARQIPVLRDIARAFSAPILEDDGFEADDLIATVVGLAERTDVKTLVQSADKDLLQLASAKTTLWDAMRGRHYQPRAVEEKLGVPPAAVADYLALVGDASDNVPGVPGVGAKTAAALLRAWGSLDGIYDALETLPPRERKKLEANRELAYLSRALTRLRADVPLPFTDLGALALRAPDLAAVTRLCERYGFRDLTPDPRRPHEVRAPPPPLATSERPLHTIRDRAGWARALAAIEASPLVGIALGERDLGLATLGGDAYEIALDLPTSQQRSLFEPAGLATSDVFGALAPVLCAPGRAVIAVDAKAVARAVMLGRVDFDAASARRLLGQAAPPDLSPGLMARAALKDRLVLAEAIAEAGLTRALQAELALTPIVSALEARGLPLDAHALDHARRQLDSARRELEQHIHTLAGRPFRVDDARALGEILFGVLGLPALKRGKTSRRSLDALALGELARAHPLPRAVLDLQRLQRLDKDCLALLDGERLRSSYTTHGPSGRMQAHGPLSAWHEACAELAPPLAEVLRAIVPSAALVTIDLAQLDLRVAAHLSEDGPLIEACIDDDPHRRMAAEIFARRADEIGPDERAIAKHLALGLLYGASAGGIASRSTLAIAEARAHLTARRARHERLLAWQALLVEAVRQSGHVSSLLGRRRALPELADPRPAVRKLAEGLAVSATITSGAADLVSLVVARIGARVVALLGDRIVVESPSDDLAERVTRVLAELGAELGLRVPLRATLHQGVTS